MKRLKFAVPVICCILCFSACQPTPETAIVIGKGDGALEETVAAPALSEEEQVKFTEEKWEETFDVHGVPCNVDAEVSVPASGTHPVYKFARSEFDLATAQSCADYFLKDAVGMRDDYLTKEELLEELRILERHWNETVFEGGGPLPEDMQQEERERIQAEIAAAPDEVYGEVAPFTELSTGKVYKMTNGELIDVVLGVQTVEVKPHNVNIMLADFYDDPSLRPKDLFSHIEISEADARSKAMELLRELGIENMGIAHIEKARLEKHNFDSDLFSEGYYIIFGRADGGAIPIDTVKSFETYIMPETEENFSPQQTVSQSMSEPWWPETITMYVDDSGVRWFQWRHPAENVGTLNENVSLMSFEDVKQSIKKYIRIGYVPALEFKERYEDIELNIDKIVLVSYYTKIKDDTEHRMFVPVWLIYYSYDPMPIEFTHNSAPHAFGINAIDGSVFSFEDVG